MIKFKNTDVWGFEHALRGMRNPMNSWNKSDSKYCGDFDECEKCNLRIDTCDAYLIGENDMNLAQKLIKGGSEHRKFLRQIFVSVDITASMYWWSEFDTYKVGTTANSTSKMHKLAETSITTDMFELNDISKNDNVFLNYINHLEEMRKQYLKTKDKNIWKSIVQQLPESWLQTRTVTLNYENLFNMYRQRKNHKLDEWRIGFIDWIKTLPYSEELIMYTEGENK